MGSRVGNEIYDFRLFDGSEVLPHNQGQFVRKQTCLIRLVVELGTVTGVQMAIKSCGIQKLTIALLSLVCKLQIAPYLHGWPPLPVQVRSFA